MSTHTPGDWYAHDQTGSHLQGTAPMYISTRGDDGILCTLACVYGSGEKEDSLESQECSANTKLIAAAPNLLDACRAARQRLYAHQSPSTKEVALQLDEAIAKAEGRA